MPFLKQVFSDDALIITGKVITQRHAEGFTSQKIKYNKQSKKEYLQKLGEVFKVVKYIKVTFDDIEVKRHPVQPIEKRIEDLENILKKKKILIIQN